MSPACSVTLKPSPTLAAILGAAHLLALAAAAISLSGLPLVLTGCGVILSGIWTAGDALLKWPGSVLRIDLEGNGSGRWVDRTGREYRIQGTRVTWVSAAVVVLGVSRSRWRTRWLVLLPDSSGTESLRRLRTWLRWRPS